MPSDTMPLLPRLFPAFALGLATLLPSPAAPPPAAVVIPEAVEDWGDPAGLDRAGVVERTMRPYAGPSHPGVDVHTLTGKVMAGYQGWFTAVGDAAGRGWTHWGQGGRFEPGNCKIDLWPDVSELTPAERYATPFRHADGRTAEVFSSFNRRTVLRHFAWMQQYGLDGVFVQRFITETGGNQSLRHVNVVLDHCREGANLYGRAYAVMYDLSGLGSNQMGRVTADWKLLVDRMHITRDPAYLRHGGKPVVSVWGLGFNDRRRYTLAEGRALVRFLKDDPQYGGCTVILGVPTYWRTLTRDTLPDPALHDLIRAADTVSPWTVGRYGTPAAAAEYAERTLKPDLEWCRAQGKEFLPVVFPGFSWHNMNTKSPPNQIPRLRGQFLWGQLVQARQAGATMVYQAMFDEVDEGTAIFKCTDDPPVGASPFVNLEGLPSDFYLRLVGRGGRLIRGEIPVSETVPGDLYR